MRHVAHVNNNYSVGMVLSGLGWRKTGADGMLAGKLATTKNKKRPWESKRSWRLRHLKQQDSKIRAEIDALLDPLDPEDDTPGEYQVLCHRLAAVNEDIELMRYEALAAQARRWRVYISPTFEPREVWVKTDYRKRLILKPQAQHDVREQIWHRKLTVIGIVFGVSSVVQAVYAVLSFYLRQG
jgi:hypothetical protein